MQRNNRPYSKLRRKQLRNDPTPAEKLLWLFLKHSQLDGRKFRRQHSYGPYIMDFYCPTERLCIELDGDSHCSPEAKAHDRAKDSYLQSHCIKVLRFTNDEVYASVEKVFERIQREWTVRRGVSLEPDELVLGSAISFSQQSKQHDHGNTKNPLGKNLPHKAAQRSELVAGCTQTIARLHP